MEITRTDFSALILIRQESFYNWLGHANKRANIENSNFYRNDHGVYLLERIITHADLELFLKKEFLRFFQSELSEWHPRELWPDELTYNLFLEFFQPQLHRQVYHLSESSPTDIPF